MKIKDLSRILKDAGYQLIRSGQHQIWGKNGHHVAVPYGSTGKEINKMVVRQILKDISRNEPARELSCG